MSAFFGHNDRKRHYPNITEEDGAAAGHDPHYYLLQELIKKLDPGFRIDQKTVIDGRIMIDDKYLGDAEAEEMVTRFHDGLYKKMTDAEASAVIAAVENPALDISAYFHKIIELCGRTELLQEDLYLSIHVTVEPEHIIASHENAEEYMHNGAKDEVINTFRNAMSFWTSFWKVAFTKLGYPDR